MEQGRKERGQQDVLLYEQHGRQLEPEHLGKFVAISDDGRILSGRHGFFLGDTELAIAQQAVAEFGTPGPMIPSTS
ncbi:MAG: hypothetical protein EXR58_01915 [Chloroflexi bacterium]|nr:hypothetical protein [Chloroflexota bacterium]